MNTKKKIQKITKKLIQENGYASVTMNGISKSLSLSKGGLYYYYHSVEEILFDIIEFETQNVWEIFEGVKDFETLMKAFDVYLLQEKSDLLNVNSTLNSIIYQYYFSLPQQDRISAMNKSYITTFDNMKAVLQKVFHSEVYINRITEHIYIILHGLNFVALSDGVTKETIESEFCMVKKFIEELYIKESLQNVNDTEK